MTKYKCGHETDGLIILDDNCLSMIAWIDWSESVGVFGDKSVCFDCYSEETSDKTAKEKLK